MKSIDASKKSNEKEVYSNLQDKRRKHNPNFKLGQLVRTADIKKSSAKEIVPIRVINYTQ